MWRPLGAQEAASLLPLFWVRGRAFAPSGLMAQRSNPLDDRRVKAIVSPRGDHRGCVSYEPPKVSRRAFPPSAPMIQIWGEPDRSEVNAISRPVGDQLGSVSMPRLLVSWRKSEVPTRSEKMSGFPLLDSVRAMTRPSGPHAGEVLIPGHADISSGSWERRRGLNGKIRNRYG